MFHEPSKKTLNSLIPVLLVSSFFLVVSLVYAQDNSSAGQPVSPKNVEYRDETIVDHDFDGLTDQGEIQIFGTSPNNPDSDGDGLLDGVEIIKGSSPIDSTDPYDVQAVEGIQTLLSRQTPWVWYLTRAAGIVGFIFLWLTVFLGLAIRNNALKRIVTPVYSFGFHCFLAATALFWAGVHGISLLYHGGNNSLAWSDVAIPFFHNSSLVASAFLGLGISAFYAMAIITVTSYIRRWMPRWLWRAVHFLNPLAFIFVVVHGYTIGTDMKNEIARNAFLASASVLVLLYLSNLFFVFWNKRNAPLPVLSPEVPVQSTEEKDRLA